MGMPSEKTREDPDGGLHFDHPQQVSPLNSRSHGDASGTCEGPVARGTDAAVRLLLSRH